MKLKLFFALVALSSVGCSHAGKNWDSDIHNKGYARECIGGVTYLVFGWNDLLPSYNATPQVDREGKPVPCEAKSK